MPSTIRCRRATRSRAQEDALAEDGSGSEADLVQGRLTGRMTLSPAEECKRWIDCIGRLAPGESLPICNDIISHTGRVMTHASAQLVTTRTYVSIVDAQGHGRVAVCFVSSLRSARVTMLEHDIAKELEDQLRAIPQGDTSSTLHSVILASRCIAGLRDVHMQPGGLVDRATYANASFTLDQVRSTNPLHVEAAAAIVTGAFLRAPSEPQRLLVVLKTSSVLTHSLHLLLQQGRRSQTRGYQQHALYMAAAHYVEATQARPATLGSIMQALSWRSMLQCIAYLVIAAQYGVSAALYSWYVQLDALESIIMLAGGTAANGTH